MSMQRAAALAVLLWSGTAWAQEQMEEKGDDKEVVVRLLGVDPEKLVTLTHELKERAKAIGEEVVCLCGTCPRHTITACTCGWAYRHKKMIEVALVEGKTRDQILEAYMKAYGTKAFPKPPGKFGALSWIIPYAGALAGLFLFLAFGLRMMKRQAAMAAVGEAKPTAGAVEDDEARAALKRELEDLD